MFVFKDMDDYKNRGKNVDAEYTKMMVAAKKKGAKKPALVIPIVPKLEPKPQIYCQTACFAPILCGF